MLDAGGVGVDLGVLSGRTQPHEPRMVLGVIADLEPVLELIPERGCEHR